MYVDLLIEMSKQNLKESKNPFAAILVKDAEIIIKSTDIPLAESTYCYHAELMVILEALKQYKNLRGMTLHTICEPCVMCAGAVLWSKLSSVVYYFKQSQLQELTDSKPKPPIDTILNLAKHPEKRTTLFVHNQKINEIFNKWKNNC